MSNKDILSPLELAEIKKWLDENQANLPEQILSMLRRMLKVYLGLSKSSRQAKQILTLLRQAMGIVPKSEKGRAGGEMPVQPDLSQMSTEQKAELLALQSKRDALSKERRIYQVKIRGLLVNLIGV